MRKGRLYPFDNNSVSHGFYGVLVGMFWCRAGSILALAMLRLSFYEDRNDN